MRRLVRVAFIGLMSVICALAIPYAPLKAETTPSNTPSQAVEETEQPADENMPTSLEVSAPEVESSHIEASSLSLENTPPPEAVSLVTAKPSPVIANDALLVSHFRFSQGLGFEYIELYNTSDNLVSLNNMQLRLLYSDQDTDYSCEVGLDGYILAEQYISFAAAPSGDIYPLADCARPGTKLSDIELQVVRAGVVIESVRVLDQDLTVLGASKAWERKGWTKSYREGVLSNDFKSSTRPDLVYTSSIYLPPLALDLEIVEIMINPNLCRPSSSELSCSSYVKLQNNTDQDIDLSLYRLRSGQRDEVSSRYNTTMLSGIVPAKGFKVLSSSVSGQSIALDARTAAVWFEDQYGVVSYPNNMRPYDKADNASNRGLVWALDSRDKSWKWGVANPSSAETHFMTAVQTENAMTGDSDLVPCRADQERNPATNRCRLTATAESKLVPCRVGQTRNPDTNRCRSTVSLASASLKPCAANQFRNPATNRCKSLASTTSSLKPCAPGQERNPATNRCRKSGDILPATAAFKPEAVKDTATAFAAWWALGGIVALGAGWAIWEYRFEIRRIIEQMTVGRK